MPDVSRYDAIIIGSGQAGGPLSTELARAGRHVALIERAFVGGTCINYGCTPTKTMVASARVAYLARRGPEYGVNVSGVSIDQAIVRQRTRDMVERFRAGSESSITGTPGVDLIYGEATFTGQKTIRVTGSDGNEQDLTADLVFINTGARSAPPTFDGIDTVPYLDSTSVMELAETPRHLLVLGGGYIGLEFAQMFRRFGSEVTVVHRGRRIMQREDEDITDCLQQILEEDGISLRLQSEATAVRMSGDSIEVTITAPDGDRTVTGSHLLVATGRIPNTDRLNLPATGVEADDKGYVTVNERLETGVDGIYALGDVKGGPAFTHISYDDYRIVRDNLLRGGSRTTGDRPVPYVVFTDPELGRIGLSEQEAKEGGKEVLVATMPMSSVARASESAETRGMMKVLVDPETDRIVGAAILGLFGGEIMSHYQLAMMGGLTCDQLADAVFAHPTLAEATNNLISKLAR
ncbi:MAG: mercuric reductase [Chloroflexota bacterium]|nr:mercuric reductase [Chloroflexota bacterium]